MKTYFNPMLNEPRNEVLQRIKRTPKQGEDKDTLPEKIFKNGAIFIARIAASDDAARGFTAWIVVCDEVDADTYRPRAGGQGSKLDLFRARFTRFHDGRIIAGGSPTAAHTSLTEKEWLQSDRQEFFVPCPHCSGVIDPETKLACDDPENRNLISGYQVLEFGDADSPYRIKFELRESDHAVLNAVYVCKQDQNHRIDEIGPDRFSWKDWMDRHGKYRPTAPGGEWFRNEYGEWQQQQERFDPDTGEVTPIPTTVPPGHRGQRIWAGYNPALSWTYPVTEFLAAKRKGVGELMVFTNNIAGQGVYSPVRASFRSSSCLPRKMRTDVDSLNAANDRFFRSYFNPLRSSR